MQFIENWERFIISWEYVSWTHKQPASTTSVTTQQGWVLAQGCSWCAWAHFNLVQLGNPGLVWLVINTHFLHFKMWTTKSSWDQLTKSHPRNRRPYPTKWLITLSKCLRTWFGKSPVSFTPVKRSRTTKLWTRRLLSWLDWKNIKKAGICTVW